MVLSHRTTFLASLVIILLAIGCSGSGGNNPLTPGDQGLTEKVATAVPSNSYFWEMGEVTIDPDTGEAQVVPLRSSEFALNVVKFLQPPSGSLSNLTVTLDLPNSDIPNKRIELNCNLTHPFPGTNFWGFDTRVIVFGAGSTTGKNDTDVKYPSASELRILNADGYTRWWNHNEFAPFDKIFGYTDGALAPSFTANFGTVNGFKYFAEGIGVNDSPPNPAIAQRGKFAAGTVTRHMNIQFPNVAQPFKFKYSVGSNWEAPTNSPPSSVSDFPAAANCQEAYQVVVTQDAGSTAFFDPDDSSFGGDLTLTIEVWDWQAAGNPAAQIQNIYVESPTLLSNQGNVVDVKPIWTQSAGSTANSVKYTGTLTNVTPNAVLNQEIFVTVVSSDGSYAPPLPGFLYPQNDPLAAYQLFKCTILDNGTPPTKSITVTSPNGGETLVIGASHNITWTWTGSITDVVIKYSTDGGSSYPNTISGSTPCDGSFTWDPIPDTPTTTAKVQITEGGASPTAQDESNNNFTISSSAQQGWNPVPGQIGLPVDNPEPNQSTVQPDLGIQNDGAGAEGAWMVDQAGGVAQGSPNFFDYMLDWSGPGGNAYPSGFNFNFAPFGHHDATSNGLALFGVSARNESTNPPVYNDPVTAIWYISYLQADEIAVPGDLFTVTWGDEGTIEPPTDDPDAEPWIHSWDASSGVPGSEGATSDDSMTFAAGYSELPGAPPVPKHTSDNSDADGDLLMGYWAYPYLSSSIYRLPIKDFTTQLQPPLANAMDVSDPSKIRLAADNNSYLGFNESITQSFATLFTLVDSAGVLISGGFQLTDDQTQFYYLPITACIKIPKTDPNYVSGGTAVDLEYLPWIVYGQIPTPPTEFNWTAVLFDMGNNTFVIRVYMFDWTVDPAGITIIDTTDPMPGTPLALDVDPINFTIHVLADNGGTIEATVFNYTQ